MYAVPVFPDYAGVVESTFGHLPFGEPIPPSDTNLGATEQHFTGKEYDTESGLNYFGARYLSTGTGRWMNPDPSGLTFADPTNPQSLNLYAYVQNNPINTIDSNGLCGSMSSGDCDQDFESGIDNLFPIPLPALVWLLVGVAAVFPVVAAVVPVAVAVIVHNVMPMMG